MRYPSNQPICIAFDDTKLVRSGRKVKSAFWQRDPLSPPFHVNFDLITLLRKEISEAPITDFLKHKIAKNIMPYAYT